MNRNTVIVAVKVIMTILINLTLILCLCDVSADACDSAYDSESDDDC